MPSVRRAAASLTVLAVLSVPFNTAATAHADVATPVNGPGVMLAGDESAAALAAWHVEWPAADVTVGSEAVATLVLEPTLLPTSFVMERLENGVWASYMTYNRAPHTGVYRVAFRLDTASVGANQYRIRQTVPVPVVESDIFTLTVHADVPPVDPNAQPTTVTISTPPSMVKVNDTVTVTGTVSGGARPVVMRFQTATGWSQVLTGTSTDTGDYSLVVPSDWYGKHVLQVSAPATAQHQAADSPARTMTVKPDFKPAGSAKAWKRISDARWNPCQPINFKMNLRGAPKGSARTVRKAFDKIHAATGFTFINAGTTSKVPFAKGKNQFENGTLIVAWTTPKKVARLAGNTVGLGGSSWTSRTVNGKTVKEYVHGGVALDRTDKKRVRPGFKRGSSQGALLMHELAHALGLSHINSRSQIMYPALLPTTKPNFGAGDLAGLRAIGAAQGCM